MINNRSSFRDEKNLQVLGWSAVALLILVAVVAVYSATVGMFSHMNDDVASNFMAGISR